MSAANQEQRERETRLLIFFIPLGVLLIIFVGQLALRVLPVWSINAGMQSNLQPEDFSPPNSLFPRLLPDILTPMAWMENYLTPGSDYSIPQFIVIETATPSPTEVTPAATQPAPTQVTPTKTPTPTSTPPATSTTASPTETEDPGGGGTPPPPPPTTCTDPAATNNGGPLPCTYPPATCQDPAANNQGQPLPCTYDPPPTCPSNSNNPGSPPPCDYGTITTIDPGLTSATPPSQLGVGTLPDNTGSGSGNIGHIADGTYIIISLSVTVSSTPDGNYDLVFYEWNNGGSVYLDLIIIGITNDGTGATYYEVFNWGNGTPDNNSNVGDVAIAEGGEDGDQEIPISGNSEIPPSETQLYDPDYVPPPTESNGPLPQTGILIDVDTAPSNPPPDTYNFVVIISPPTLPGGDGGPAQVDAIQAIEVPIPP